MKNTLENTHSLEEQFFGNFQKSLEAKFNLDSRHACEVALEVMDILQHSEINFEEAYNYSKSHIISYL